MGRSLPSGCRLRRPKTSLRNDISLKKLAGQITRILPIFGPQISPPEAARHSHMRSAGQMLAKATAHPVPGLTRDLCLRHVSDQAGFASTAVTRTAENLNSGILPNGSRAGLVRMLAAAST